MSSRPIPAPATPWAVDLVVPCYRQSHYLRECLESLQAQTLTSWRAVVVDDASPDGARVAAVVSAVGDPRIRVVRHERNQGLAAARNTGLRQATAAVVACVDADDRLAPTFLERLTARMAEEEALDAVFPDVQCFGRHRGLSRFTEPPPGEPLLHPDFSIPGAGTLMKRDLWSRLGGYDEHAILRRGREDFEFWMRAFAAGCRVARVEEPLYEYRITHASMSTSCRPYDGEVFAYLAEKHAALFPTERERRALLAFGHDGAALAAHFDCRRLTSFRHASTALRLRPEKARVRALARSLLTPSQSKWLTDGNLRRLAPGIGYPLRGRERYRPFFVIGVARSGTTLLRRMLTAHSALHVPPETFVLGALLRRFRRYSRALTWPELVQMVLGEFEMHPEFHTFGIQLAPLAAELRSLPRRERNLAAILDAFYRFHAAAAGKTPERWGDKTPMNSLDDDTVAGRPVRRLGRGVPQTLERLRRVFPDAQFIHIVRHGADVARSHLEGGFTRDPRQAAMRWMHGVSQCHAFVERHRGDSMEIRYEDLVGDPETSLGRLCAFLGVAVEPLMLRSESTAAGLGDVPEWFWHEQVARPVDRGRVGRWSDYFFGEEKRLVDEILGDTLLRLGYPRLTGDGTE